MRSLWMAWDEQRRFFEMHLVLAREQGARVEKAILDAAEDIPRDQSADDPAAARLADAATEVMTSSGRGARPTVVVHAEAAALDERDDGRRHLAETSSGVQLTADEVGRIGCEATWLVSAWRDGRPVELRTIGRAPTEHQMELIRFRDRGCTFPGCGSRRYIHVHHITHWAQGGKTTLENLTLLCGSHHRRVHEGGWTIRGRPPEELEFVSRTGTVLRRAGPVLPRAG